MKKLIACLLGGLLCAGLLGCMTINGVSSFHQYPEAEKYSVGNFSYAAGDITRVEVDWVAGSMQIKQSDKATLQVEETGELTPEQQLHYLLEDGVLKIQYCASGYTGTFPVKGKELTVEIPEGIDLSVDSVSGDVILGDGTFGELRLDTISGSIRGDKLSCTKRMKADTTSGSVRIGWLETLEADAETTSGDIDLCLCGQEAEIGTTSGSITLKLEKGKRVEVESTSGSVILELGETLGGATVDFDSTTGSLHADGYTVEHGYCIFGGGSCEIQVETTSGSLTIK